MHEEERVELSYPVVSPVLTWPHFSLLGLNYINSLFQQRHMNVLVLLKLQSHDIFSVTNTKCQVFKVESVQRNLFFFGLFKTQLDIGRSMPSILWTHS